MAPRLRLARAALLVALAATAATEATVGSVRELKLATWNLEWLIAPETFRALAASCAPKDARIAGSTRQLPCDVVADLNRSRRDFDALAGYARALDADIIALQEVDGPDAARLVFPEYRFCFTGRRNVQNNGFAIRPGIPFRCGRDFRSLSLDDSVRRGAEVVLFPGEPREVRLLSVHLKSGCGSRLLDSGRKECTTLARQAGPLEEWMDAQAAANRPFAVMGDFNRILSRDMGPARSSTGRLQRLWPEIDDGEPPEADLTNAAEGERFANCAMNQAFSGYIDQILLSRSLAAQAVPGSFERLVYRTEDALRRKLSDHCPIAIRVKFSAVSQTSDHRHNDPKAGYETNERTRA